MPIYKNFIYKQWEKRIVDSLSKYKKPLRANRANHLRVNYLQDTKIKLRKNPIKSDSFNFCKDSEKMRN